MTVIGIIDPNRYDFTEPLGKFFPPRYNSKISTTGCVRMAGNPQAMGSSGMMPAYATVRQARRPATDYANQLDLFSQANINAPAPIAAEPPHPSGVSHVRPRPPQQLNF